MGNKNVAEIDSQRIAEIATEANGQFAKEFSISFKDAVTNKIKKAYIQQGGPVQSLMQADIPTKDIKAGYLIKMGANVRSWKRRYFVAHNQADNYAISYAEDSGSGSMVQKGRFFCWGYDVEAFDMEEIGKYGLYGIKLKPRDDSKRMWLLRAETEDEQVQWMEVFVNACKKSRAEPERDAVLIEAFRVAYRTTRTSYGYFGIFHTGGTECEMLEYLTNQILSREVLDSYLQEQSSSRSSVASRKSKAQNLYTSVQKIVKPIVASTWKGSLATVESTRASFELSVKASLRTLLDKEQEIKNFLQGRIRVLVDPYIPDFQASICLPILKCCFEAVVEAYEQALVGFHTEVKTIIGSSEYYGESMSEAFSTLRDSVEQVNASPLEGAQRIMWKLHTQDLESVCDVLETSGVSGYDIYLNTMSDLRILLQNALFTFVRTAKDAHKRKSAAKPLAALPKDGSTGDLSTTAPGGGDKSSPMPSPPSPATGGESLRRSSATGGTLLVEVLNEVISKLTADAKLSLHKGLSSLLTDALEGRMQEHMIAPCYEVVLAAQSLVTRETQLMINLYSIGENMVREMVLQYVHALIEDLVAEASSRLNMVAVQLLNDVSKK